MASPRSGTAFGEMIETVKEQLVSMSETGMLTRVFDQVENRVEDIEYFRVEMSKIFQNQMTGQQPVQVTVKSVSDLQNIIRVRVNQVLLSDSRITEALEAIADPVKRGECMRDIAVAFANKLTAVINVEARMAAKISPGSEQEKNVKAYMEFVRRVNNLHDKTPEEAVDRIRTEATKELADVIRQAKNVWFGSKETISLVKAGSFSSSPKGSPSSRSKDVHATVGKRLNKSSSGSGITSSASTAAAAAAAAAFPDSTPSVPSSKLPADSPVTVAKHVRPASSPVTSGSSTVAVSTASSPPKSPDSPVTDVKHDKPTPPATPKPRKIALSTSFASRPKSPKDSPTTAEKLSRPSPPATPSPRTAGVSTSFISPQKSPKDSPTTAEKLSRPTPPATPSPRTAGVSTSFISPQKSPKDSPTTAEKLSKPSSPAAPTPPRRRGS